MKLATLAACTTCLVLLLAGAKFANAEDSKCAIQSYTLRTDVHLRYATSMIQIQVTNPERNWRTQDCSLNVVIPETAFLTGILAEVGDKVVKTRVIERSNDEQDEFEQENPEGDDGSFEVPRDSKLIKIGLTLKAKEEAVLYITHEQSVMRKLGIYELVLNLHPGQIVPLLRVDVMIVESRELAVLRVMGIRSGLEIDPLDGQSEFPLAKIIRASENEAHVIFSPSRKQQSQLANSRPRLSNGESAGLSGQLVVQFELTRQKDGEMTVRDGYFVHHYAPTALSILPKHVVFVLDLSSSMAGRRLSQLKLAMEAILDELRSDDFFSIVQFNSFKSVWSPLGKEKKNRGNSDRIVRAKPHNIAKAKRYIKKLKAMGGTNIQKALVKAISIAHTSKAPLSLVVLLTDGETTVGESEPSVILNAAKNANRREEECKGQEEGADPDIPCSIVKHVPIYSLAFGEEANIYFLRRLSSENYGSARRIYDADDAAIQLHEVYAELAAPVQADCTFQYPQAFVVATWTTQHKFAAAFLGSEIVVAGKVLDYEEGEEEGGDFWGEVKGVQESGEVSSVHLFDPDIKFYPTTKFNPKLSHFWGYLTVYQLMMGSADKDSRDEATQVALKYSFVTATTTLLPHYEGDQDDVATSIMRIHLPASQEIGNMVGDGKGSGDVCTEGGEGEYWFPLQQAFVPCGERKVMTHVPSSSQQHSSERFHGRNQIHERNNFVDESAEKEADLTREQKYNLVDLESLSWLKEVRYGPRYLVLPKGRHGENQLFSLGLNESNEANSPCLSPLKEPSHCRHLHYCAIEELRDDFYEFLRYFCSINHFAGVCCPDSLFLDGDNMPPLVE